ncbi:hypothetical protein EV189_1092 [Motilibacter rhizosphaerae]|uniref:Uncharacterized protein n=1 Tax=Motilibacter rhizosphaerae TaxID=598652 RepID=A0A4Q7NXV8_9ACTN|nr:hypothetical protein [Motilibacter rhizosphaerae]RZS91840.1 hypothetical protein EV189_1092 [Motilibacter rhizosphaerae]
MPERKVDVLVVRWYERAASASDIADRWLAAAREHLPEALPRRFGEVEPLRGRLDRDGEDGFRRAAEQAESLLHLAGTAPVYSASLCPHRPPRSGPTVAHSLSAVLDPDDERVRRFALALASAGTMYVSASVEGGETLDRGQLWGPGDRPAEPYLAGLGEWLGLPPAPPRWCWFGPDYTGLLGRGVSGERTAGGLLWTGGPWVDERLRARLDEVEPSRRYAARLPGGAPRSLWRRLLR